MDCCKVICGSPIDLARLSDRTEKSKLRSVELVISSRGRPFFNSFCGFAGSCLRLGTNDPTERIKKRKIFAVNTLKILKYHAKGELNQRRQNFGLIATLVIIVCRLVWNSICNSSYPATVSWLLVTSTKALDMHKSMDTYCLYAILLYINVL